ncbi:hypothetical protein CWI39_2215p0010 [Hamiltosporidium magnivora]|uniref:Uncharacterized protein n=1 Tax=Hamiltosporidium magnivora TaxID=148818 RepID=A0A4Q9LJ75_9MICR|nr:hypothetical protein CWI39_2215p0010 [Hamiltosporidium magnivora]TBU08194.1 hypothetical protein CWI36_0170p0030 [Hamiltosporidium magnivora]
MILQVSCEDKVGFESRSQPDNIYKKQRTTFCYKMYSTLFIDENLSNVDIYEVSIESCGNSNLFKTTTVLIHETNLTDATFFKCIFFASRIWTININKKFKF